jgi:hypothetical protein
LMYSHNGLKYLNSPVLALCIHLSWLVKTTLNSPV